MVEEPRKNGNGFNALERAQISEIVEARLAALGLTDLRNEVHDIGMRIKTTEDKVSVIHKVLIDENSKDTIVSKVNAIQVENEKRTIADAELRAMRRQIMAAVIISILLSTGAVLWQVLKQYP